MNDYKALSDEKLIFLSQNNDEKAQNEIIDRYKNLVKKIARSFFVLDGGTDDLIQEGMIGLFKAVKNYSPLPNKTFLPYAYRSIKNAIITYVKKCASLNSVKLISMTLLTEESGSGEVLVSADVNPEQRIIDNETIKGLNYKIDKELTKLEKNVLPYYLDGDSYEEIAKKINKKIKSVDNAVQRIRKKIKAIIGG